MPRKIEKTTKQASELSGVPERFRELFIKVDKDHSGEFAVALDAALSDGWARAHSCEQEARQHGLEDRELFYYYCTERQGRAAAMVAIYRRDAETLYVSNVVPLRTHQLKPPQYNEVLRDFHDVALLKMRAGFPVFIVFGV